MFLSVMILSKYEKKIFFLKEQTRFVCALPTYPPPYPPGRNNLVATPAAPCRFYTLYLYRLWPLLLREFTPICYTWILLSQTDPLVGSLWPSFCRYLSHFVVFRWWLRDRFQPLPSHRFCGFGLKHRRGLFGATWSPGDALGWLWQSLVWFLLRLTYCAEATDSP